MKFLRIFLAFSALSILAQIQAMEIVKFLDNHKVALGAVVAGVLIIKQNHRISKLEDNCAALNKECVRLNNSQLQLAENQEKFLIDFEFVRDHLYGKQQFLAFAAIPKDYLKKYGLISVIELMYENVGQCKKKVESALENSDIETLDQNEDNDYFEVSDEDELDQNNRYEIFEEEIPYIR